jgi:UDP-3-O-[3-hydroxymyristoyl] glucosamine N-acyltransferase
MAVKFSQLLTQLGIDLSDSAVHLEHGDPELTGVAPLAEAQATHLSFLENMQFFPQLASTQAGALLLPEDTKVSAAISDRPIPHVLTKHPRLLFARAITILHPSPPAPQGIHPTAVIAEGVDIPPSAYIAAHVVIGAGVRIGEEVQIYPNCTIYEGVTIGDRTVIHANSVIHPYTAIGRDCVIHSGAVIGSEGFGFVPDSQGKWIKMPQIGRVVLEDQVEVGCNSCIDRGAIGETRIGQGTKIDNLVQIAHGCKTGRDCLLAGQVGLSGGVTLGNNVILAGQVGVANHVHLGDGVVAAAKSGIHDDQPPKAQVMGYPAFSAKEFFKASAVFRRLPELQKVLRRLQKHLPPDPQA